MEPVERWPYAPQIALQIKEPKSDIPKKQMNYKGYVRDSSINTPAKT